MSDVGVPSPEELPLAVLMRLARREVEDDSGDVATPALSALHRRPSREVFDQAAAIVGDSDTTRRILGVRILRELGGEQLGEQPFRTETVSLMRVRLREETDPAVLRWIVSALGYNHGREALLDVVALAGHPDDGVRFHVAAALPSLVNLDGVEPEAVDALIRLCHDDDSDTRYYALYAATREIGGLDAQMVLRLTAQLFDDPDEQVRAMATAHHEAIHEVREMLGSAFEPRTATGAYDHLIGPVLVTLACAGYSGDARPWLDEEIRRHLGTAAAECRRTDLADQVVTWWTEKQNRMIWS
ncbi:HEAT repeat domain-containing protein [Micromonosporaceae bacterium Da 78-11]